MKIAVVGVGVVGSHMVKDIEQAGNECVKHDIRHFYSSKAEVNTCEAAFVCVGTPELPNGKADLSSLEEVFSWLEVPVIIVRSTYPPGAVKHSENAVFSPELIGEGVNAPYNHMRQPPFIVIGGTEQARKEATYIYSAIYNAECEVILMDYVTAQMVKYAVNTFLATKVTLSNEFYNICMAVGADYQQMINAVGHDYRIGRSHTQVFPDNRGFGGRCFPKDTSALLEHVGPDIAPLLAAVRRVNDEQRTYNRPLRTRKK
jgi:UDPglucose 6-dehydrogenase